MSHTVRPFFFVSECLPVFLGATMTYLAPMELQTQIDELKAEVAKLKALLNGGNPRFGIITCDGWRVVDKDGTVRIDAATRVDGEAGVAWMDKDGKVRIGAATRVDGEASVGCYDKDGTPRIGAVTDADGQARLLLSDKDGTRRIGAGTLANGSASVALWDKDGTPRIGAATFADGTVGLPTKDLKKQGGWGWLLGNAQ